MKVFEFFSEFFTFLFSLFYWFNTLTHFSLIILLSDDSMGVSTKRSRTCRHWHAPIYRTAVETSTSSGTGCCKLLPPRQVPPPLSASQFPTRSPGWSSNPKPPMNSRTQEGSHFLGISLIFLSPPSVLLFPVSLPNLVRTRNRLPRCSRQLTRDSNSRHRNDGKILDFPFERRL